MKRRGERVYSWFLAVRVRVDTRLKEERYRVNVRCLICQPGHPLIEKFSNYEIANEANEDACVSNRWILILSNIFDVFYFQ